MLDKLEALEREFADVQARMADPGVHADQSKYAELARRYKELEPIIALTVELRERTGDLEVAKEMFADTTGADREEMRSEVDGAERDISRLEDELSVLLLPKDPNEGRNVIVEIRGAEGGEEANLFARDLFDMFKAYAGRMGWRFELLEADVSDMGGYLSLIHI